MTDSAILKKGTPVTIMGLQSEEGKKLNGGQGIVLNKPTTTDSVARYPVLIFALLCNEEEGGGFTLLDNSIGNKIKSENLKEITDKSDEQKELWIKACKGNAIKANQAGDIETSMLWTSFCYHQMPEDHGMAITYAMMLLMHKEKPDEAFDVVQNYVNNPAVRSDKDWPKFCYDFSWIYIKAGKKLDDALEFVLQIPKDAEGPPGVNQSQECLFHLVKALNKKIKEEYNPTTIHALSPVYIRAAKISAGRMQWGVKCLHDLGASCCLANDHLEGAKWHRVAIASGKLCNAEVQQVKGSLILAQCQCHGMLLDDYVVITTDEDGVASCIPKNKIHEVIVESFNGLVSVKRRENDGITTQVVQIGLPKDPDDPEFFPPEFLQQLMPTEELCKEG